jgi:hypothetical protein
MRAGGLAVEALFPAAGDGNPTLTRWRELIGAGFPFIKVQLLRENPAHADIDGWQEIVRAGGLDPALIEEHLASRRAAS